MTDLDQDDRAPITDAVNKIVAGAAMRRMHGQIASEATGYARAKRWAGAFGGLVLGLLFLAFFFSLFRAGVQNRHLPPKTFSMIYPLFLYGGILAFVPLSFSAYFLMGYRHSMAKCLCAGLVLAVVAGALAAWYQAHISV